MSTFFEALKSTYTEDIFSFPQFLLEKESLSKDITTLCSLIQKSLFLEDQNVNAFFLRSEIKLKTLAEINVFEEKRDMVTYIFRSGDSFNFEIPSEKKYVITIEKKDYTYVVFLLLTYLFLMFQTNGTFIGFKQMEAAIEASINGLYIHE